MIVLLALLFVHSISAAPHPCTQHISSCRNCMADTVNNCQFCATNTGLGQCLPPNDRLVNICQLFQGQNQTTLITNLNQCPAAGSRQELCAARSTNNEIKCGECVADTANGCGWCGTATTGSCNAVGTGAGTLCTLLLGGELISGSASAGKCPSNSVPNYCVAYSSCDACQADNDCVHCLAFDAQCVRDDRCVAKADSVASCTSNNRSSLVTAGQCANLPSSCAELTSGAGGGTTAAGGATTAAGGSTAAGGTFGPAPTTAGGLPEACDDIKIVDDCVARCKTSNNVDQCKCNGASKVITCLDAATTAGVVATSDAGRGVGGALVVAFVSLVVSM